MVEFEPWTSGTTRRWESRAISHKQFADDWVLGIAGCVFIPGVSKERILIRETGCGGAKNRSMDSADAGSDPWRGKLLAPYMSTEKCQMDGPHRNVKWIWRQLFFMVKECAVFFFIFGDVYGDNIRDPVANVGLIGSFFCRRFKARRGARFRVPANPVHR